MGTQSECFVFYLRGVESIRAMHSSAVMNSSRGGRGEILVGVHLGDGLEWNLVSRFARAQVVEREGCAAVGVPTPRGGSGAHRKRAHSITRSVEVFLTPRALNFVLFFFTHVCFTGALVVARRDAEGKVLVLERRWGHARQAGGEWGREPLDGDLRTARETVKTVSRIPSRLDPHLDCIPVVSRSASHNHLMYFSQTSSSMRPHAPVDLSRKWSARNSALPCARAGFTT